MTAGLLSGCRPAAGPVPIHTGGRHVVVLVPGWMSGGAQLRPISEEIRAAVGAEVHRLELTGLGVTETFPEYAVELSNYVQKLKLGPADRLDLVGFSFGGLVCRWYAEVLRGELKPTWIVTVCTPHHGTTKGRGFKIVTTLREMQPGAGTILKLAGSRREGVEYFSVRLSRDNVVKPQCSSILPGAKNYQVEGKTHQMAPYNKHIKATVRAIYEGKAVPSGPQQLSEQQIRLLGLPDGLTTAPPKH
jgi:triacylglycerol lipase